eukprot:c16941_g1_i1 orf=88-2619(+)
MSSAASQQLKTQEERGSPLRATGIQQRESCLSEDPHNSSSSKSLSPPKLKAISHHASLLLNELKCLVPAGNAQQQALQQQALHQAALHQQTLKHHNDLHNITTHAQLQQLGNINVSQHSVSLPSCLPPQPLATVHSRIAKMELLEADSLSACSAHYQDAVDSCARFADDDDVKNEGSVERHMPAERVQSDDHKSLMPKYVGVIGSHSKLDAVKSFNSTPVDESFHSAECSSSILDDQVQAQRLEQIKDIGLLKDGVDGFKNLSKVGDSRPKSKGSESGADGEVDIQVTAALPAKEENIKGLKAGLIHVAHKMPRNAHAHFVLGLMYQRLEQPAQAASAFQKADEILKKAEEELGQNRAQLLAAVQCHYTMSMLQAKVIGKVCLGTNLQSSEIESWVKDLKFAVQTDPCHALVWNTLGLVLFQTGQTQSAISIFRSLLCALPNCLDALANLGVAYLHSGHVADAARCLQLLLEKDGAHPGALLNYGNLLLRQYSSSFAGAGAGGSNEPEKEAITTAKKFLTAALQLNPKAGHLWASLAAAYSMLSDFRSSTKCLEQASKLEPTRLSTRYAVAMQRVHEAQFSFAAPEQLSWAANEMVSILRVADSTTLQPQIAWVGLARVNRMQHELISAFEGDEVILRETKARAFHTLQQAVEENPHDPMQWQQLGLYTLCTLQFRLAQGFFKMAIAQRQTCGATWSNLGISLQLSEELSLAEEVYQKALSLVPRDKAHSILSNLGNLHRQQGRFTDAHADFEKALEICPNYAPACNNLGLLLVVEGKLDEAIKMFDCALLSDALLDAAKSNKMKAQALARLRERKALSYLGGDGIPFPSECSVYGCAQTCNS